MPPPMVSILRNRFRALMLRTRRHYLISIWKMDIGKGCQISFSAKLDKTNPRGIHIGDYSIITFGVVILSHDAINDRHMDTRIGKYCFIGARSFILPGVKIGDYAIIGGASVVVNDIPAASLAVGNPARVVKSRLTRGYYGREVPASVRASLEPP
jgi:acetyltransferase-like isoleucine patch superfamily enzyme